MVDEVKSQAEICRILGCTNATVRHWMQMVKCGMSYKWQENGVGRPSKVGEDYLKRLKVLVSYTPRDYEYAFRRWTADWLSKHLAKEFGGSNCNLKSTHK